MTLAPAADGKLPLKTEEHALSMVLPILPSVHSGDVPDRIWTASGHPPVNGTEGRPLVLRVPSEKVQGIPRVLQATLDTISWFWTAPAKIFVQDLIRRTRVAERSPLRRARDWADQLSRRLHTRGD